MLKAKFSQLNGHYHKLIPHFIRSWIKKVQQETQWMAIQPSLNFVCKIIFQLGLKSIVDIWFAIFNLSCNKHIQKDINGSFHNLRNVKNHKRKWNKYQTCSFYTIQNAVIIPATWHFPQTCVEFQFTSQVHIFFFVALNK